MAENCTDCREVLFPESVEGQKPADRLHFTSSALINLVLYKTSTIFDLILSKNALLHLPHLFIH